MSTLPGVSYELVTLPAPRVLRTGVPLFLGRVPNLSGPAWLDSAAGLPDTDGTLAQVVRGFFANGGRVCCVVPYARNGQIADQLTQLAAALESVAGYDEFDLVCAPELVLGRADVVDAPLLQQALLEDCAGHGDRFAVLDAVPGSTEVVVAQSKILRDSAAAGWGALYHPWLSTDGAGWVPPSGHVAGVYARLDQSAGAHRAPANVPLRDVTDLAGPVPERELAALSAAAVNPITTRRGAGPRIWGARTLNQDDAWRDVAVCRTVITVTRWLRRFLAEVMFEPNDQHLWRRITRETSGFLGGLYDRGALRGATADEAFFVSCDDTTNTPASIASGRVITRVGLALTRPAEFIDLRVLHGAGAVDVQAA